MNSKDICYLCKFYIPSGRGVDYFCDDCIKWTFTFDGLMWWNNYVGFVNTLVILDILRERREQIF